MPVCLHTGRALSVRMKTGMQAYPPVEKILIMNKDAALVVFSGGQDSTTCLFWAKRNFKKVYALSFLYGQKHQKEVELAREIARKA